MEQAYGRIATFYSYKGGTGRTMALANFAWILAASGKRILAIDWDLEAPGLHRFFRPFLIDPDLFETDGLIDTIWTFAAAAMASPPPNVPKHSDDIGLAIEDSKRRLDWKFPTGGYIDFVGAGRQGATYSERVNTFDWKRFYDVGGARMLTAAKARLRMRYDWILIDSRTGVSDTAGICTMQLPDIVAAFFTLNRQSVDGVSAVLRSIRSFQSASVDGSKIEFFPVATRIENAEQARLEVARGYARSSLSGFLPRNAQASPRDYWDKMELAYRPAYAFEETLSAFGDATGATGAADTMASQIELMSQLIAGDDTLRMPEILEADRESVLTKYALGPSTRPLKWEPNAVGVDNTDIEFLRGIRVKEQQWRNSNFSWQYLLSSRELELLNDEDKKEFGRNMVYYLANSERAQQFFRIVDTLFVGIVPTVVFIAFLFYVAFRPVIAGESIPPTIGIILFFGYPVVAALFGLLASRMRPPYGVGLGEVIGLVARGPLRAPIRDYN
jgi:cellulose biosynthesis protein BcsQ